MDARITDFVGLLRQNGLRVSPAEVADAARATLLIGVEERDPFRSALRATLVKRGPDAAGFDRLFDFYFRGLQSPLQRGFYARRLLQAAGGTRAEQELQELLLRLQQRGFDPGSLEVISRRVSDTLKGLEDAARRIADREQKARDPEHKGE